MTDIAVLMNSREYIIFDGAMGTMLQKYGLKPGDKPDLMCITSKDALLSIHRQYIEAGSDIICANTFGSNAFNLQGTGYSPEQVITAAVDTARKAAAGRVDEELPVLIALDIGPTGRLLEPFGDLSFEDAYEVYKEMAIAGEKAGAGIAVCETMSDAEELKAAMTAVKENTELPVFAMMTFEKSGRTFMGCTPGKFVETAEICGAAAIGLNCSLEPVQMVDIVKQLSNATELPLIVKPNAGLPDAMGGQGYIGAEEFTSQMLPYAQMGVKIVGGCCGTTPEHIAALKKAFSNRNISSYGI